MSDSADGKTSGANEADASEGDREDRYSLRPGELEWVFNSALQWNTLRLKLLTALQGSLSIPRGEDQDASSEDELVDDLKATLTNIIIMQTRVNEQDKKLVASLGQAQRRGLLKSVEVEAEDAHNWAESIAQAYRHIEERASTSEDAEVFPRA